MIPGEYLLGEGDIIANQGRRTVDLTVTNTADRPIQIGSHFHFFEVNRALRFDRALAFGMRLNVPAGTAVRFEPGDEKRVTLVELGGARRVFGLNALPITLSIGQVHDAQDAAGCSEVLQEATCGQHFVVRVRGNHQHSRRRTHRHGR